MRRFKPIHGILVVLLFMGAVWAAETVLQGSSSSFKKVSPDRSGQVRIDLEGLGSNEVRFFRFLNSGNQEVLFLVGRDTQGEVQVGFDASETHARVGRGFRHEGEWLVDNKCDTASRLSQVNRGGGGCRPVPLRHRIEGNQLVLTEADILEGWRLFS